MLRKLTAAGLVTGAAVAALSFAAPAHADGSHGGDQQFNQNLQVVPITLCNTNASVLGVTVPIGSPQTTGDCTNGPKATNLSSDDAYAAIPE